HPVAFCVRGEDGIRDFHVTGVQTCALPISLGCRTLSCIRQDQRSTTVVKCRARRRLAAGELHELSELFCVRAGVALKEELGVRADRKSVVEGERRALGGGGESRVKKNNRAE